MKYLPGEIEPKWRKWWQENKVYEVPNESPKPKCYVLDMFPYPSGAGLHVGHPLGYIASDILARYRRMQGYNVLHPMGYDAFGLPAEQYAIQTGVHPAISTERNIQRYRQQLELLGFSYDWSREIRTCDPKYYRWTQWIFLLLFKHWYCQKSDKARPISELIEIFEKEGNRNVQAATSQETTFTAEEWKAMSNKEKDDVLMNYRLAYRKVTYVWWCEELGTVLANDEVKDGVSERGGFPVERKPMLQWSLRITAYAQRLLDDLQELDFSEAMKKTQANWIGRSEGARIFFELDGHEEKIEVFTTRPDTIFGATFMVLAPEHPLVKKITTPEHRKEVEDYLAYVNTRSERDRMAETKTVSGAFTGAYAINPFTKQKIPVWIAEYVLMDYGTGAIMAVPADDERDRRFAEKFNLPIVEIIDKSMYPGATIEDKVGKMINSGFLDGMEVEDAIQAIIARIEQMGIGRRQVNFKLRDAIFSRQRYWGEPFPIIYDPEGVAHAVPDEELPVELPPLDDFKPSKGAASPLARLTDWVNLPNGWKRETDTMPGFAGSSWYFLRYMDPHNDREFASKQALEYWRDVDVYIGGTEHAVGHLMYSRFWHKFLYDLGLVPTKEPYRKLVNQGMIQGIIEHIFLQKEKVDGKSRFVSYDIAKEEGLDNFARIPVLIDFVSDYGTEHSYLSLEGVKKFIEWRPEFKNARFECKGGVFEDGVFKPATQGAEFKMLTLSEVGKMSKSKYNVVNPDDVVAEYGADCFRMYEMFLGPLDQDKPWNTNGIDGVFKFLRKCWQLFFDDKGQFSVSDEKPTKKELRILHTCIRKVREDLERLAFNTCVSAFMICVNELKAINCNKRDVLDPLVRLLAPFAPHLAEELWHRLGHHTTVCDAPYPDYDEAVLVEDTVTYPVCINGKKRDLVELPANLSKQEIEAMVPEMEVVKKWTADLSIRKIIVVPGSMINVVAS
ncbi:MAG: leucine--tRNA ligase [Saprospiraceae bacterium]|nr:MAG: leucine--tRNA ligase [Saprospiraceae bacterium]